MAYEPKKQPDPNDELFAEGIFYAIEGHEDQLKEWVARVDEGTRDRFFKQMEMGLRNCQHMIENFEKQLTNFQAAIDIIDDFVTEPAAEEEEEVTA